MFTFGQLIRKIDGIIKQKNESEKSEMERTRWQILCLVQPHIKRKLKLQDIAVFDWEKKQKKDVPLSPEKITRIAEKLKGRPMKEIKIEKLLNNG